MTRLKKTVLPFALVAAMLHGLVLSGCGARLPRLPRAATPR